MKKAAKIGIWTVAVLVVLTLAVGLGGGMYMVKYALQPEDRSQDEPARIARMEEKYPGLGTWIDSLRTANVLRDTVILDNEGLKMHAWIAGMENAGGTAVVVHGYTSSSVQIMQIARMYRDSLGWNIVVPDLHGHGKSEGDDIQMGWFDRLTVMQWIDVANDIWGSDKMVVHGISMGGATTMMVSGEDLPEYVRGFVDDCGYTSVWDQFRKELKGQFGLPPFPILYGADLVCKLRFGWGFKEASSVKQLAKCTRPMLFIHGDTDDYVLTENIYKNYEAKTQGEKYMWVVPDTDHGNSYRNHPAEYTQHVREFVEAL